MIKNINRKTLILLLFSMVTGVIIVWWIAYQTEKNMRSVLLQQAGIAAMALNVDHMSSLAGSEDDIDSTHYQHLKAQLARMRQAVEECRFLYLMGRHADGKVFFSVDSLPADSEDYAPPGTIYDEISDSYLQSFDSKQKNVINPIVPVGTGKLC